MCATCVPILVFLYLCVRELFPIYATDRRQTATSLNAPAEGRRHGLRERSDIHSVYEVTNMSLFAVVSAIGLPYQCQCQ